MNVDKSRIESDDAMRESGINVHRDDGGDDDCDDDNDDGNET
jgi:hypothetical protein